MATNRVRGSPSLLLPNISSIDERLAACKEQWNTSLPPYQSDLTDWESVEKIFREVRPDAVVHLGECPSAPYSMADVQHTTRVQNNNLLGTLHILHAMQDIGPHAHLVKFETMGGYGTPDIDIPEGFFEIEYRGRTDRLPFPRQAGSWYHWKQELADWKIVG